MIFGSFPFEVKLCVQDLLELRGELETMGQGALVLFYAERLPALGLRRVQSPYIHGLLKKKTPEFSFPPGALRWAPKAAIAMNGR
jgi:hypothetical protein